MKNTLLIFIILCISLAYTNAQDTIYVYKNGNIVNQTATNDVDSIIFRPFINGSDSCSWQWAESIEAGNDHIINSIAADANGNIYIAGEYTNQNITFGSIVLTNSASGTYDMFIAKCDSNGTFLWAKSFGGANDDKAKSVNVDINGNVYLTGYYESSSISFGTTELTNIAYSDIFLFKFTSDGNVIWAKCAGTNDYEEATSVKTDLAGNAFITGFFEGTSITFGSTVINNAGSGSNSFLAKYDSNGNVIWAKSSITNNILDGAYSKSVSSDAAGNTYIVGNFHGTVIFGSTTLTISTNSRNIFIVKYDANGNLVWAKAPVISNSEQNPDYNNNAYSVAVDFSGNIYVAGDFNSPTFTFDTITLTPVGGGPQHDMFIVKYDADGNVIWAKSAGGSNYDNGSSVAVDALGNVYLSGVFQSNSISFDSYTLSNSGVADAVIVKYDTDGNVLCVKRPIGYSSELLTCSVVDYAGHICVSGEFYGNTLTFDSITITNSNNYSIFLSKLNK